MKIVTGLTFLVDVVEFCTVTEEYFEEDEETYYRRLIGGHGSGSGSGEGSGEASALERVVLRAGDRVDSLTVIYVGRCKKWYDWHFD